MDSSKSRTKKVSSQKRAIMMLIKSDGFRLKLKTFEISKLCFSNENKREIAAFQRLKSELNIK